jgi:hypothetical protein
VPALTPERVLSIKFVIDKTSKLFAPLISSKGEEFDRFFVKNLISNISG